MKKLMLIISILSICNHLQAQVILRVLNQDSLPLPNAAIGLIRVSDSLLVKSALTDSMGNATVQPDAGSYYLQVTYINYESWRSSSFDYNPGRLAVNFSNIILHSKSSELTSVSVRAKKPLIRQDVFGTTVNVEGSLLSKGSSVLEILERSPGVIIDQRNGGISLNGKTGVLVMINGRTLRVPVNQLVTILAAMSANDVEKIELLNTPPASFDADGSGGIIRIVSRKNTRKGINGSVSLTAGQSWGSKANAGFNLAGSGARFNWQTAYLYSMDRAKTDLYIEGSQTMPVFGGDMSVVVRDTTRATQQNHNLSVGAFYQIDSATSYGLTLTGNLSNRDQHIANHSNYRLYPDSLLFLRAGIASQNQWKDWSAATFFERITKRKNKYSINADYMQFVNANPSMISTILRDATGKPAGTNDPLFAQSQRGFANTSIKVSVIKGDYEINISPVIKLETGVKVTYTRSNSNSGIESLINMQWKRRDETINEVLMQEYISAAYFSTRIQLNALTELTAGGRFEAAGNKLVDPATDTEILQRKLNRFFPSLFFVRRGANKEWQFSYTERITRPSYNDLASFVRYSDATAVYTGNPLLKPAITRNIKMGLVYKSFGFTLHLSRDDNPIAYYQVTAAPLANLLYVSPQNLRYQNYYSLQVNAPLKVTSWWNINGNYTGGWRQFAIDYTMLPIKKIYFAQSINFSQVFTFPKNYSAEVSAWFISRSYNGSTAVSNMGAVNAGIKKDLNKNRGRIQFAITDIFRTLQIVSRYGTLTREAFDIRNVVEYSAETRTTPYFRLSYSRSFGSKPKADSQRNADSDARSRLRKD